MWQEMLCAVLVLCQFHVLWARDLVLMGGGMAETKQEAWDRIIDLAGGPGQAHIGVVSSASADPPDSGSYYVNLFLNKGAAEAVFIPIHEGNLDANEDPDVIAELNRMTGFFFSGGDQARIINSWYHDPHTDDRRPSPALTALRMKFDDGAVVSGTSAGAVCYGTPVMMMGGYSWEALLYGAYEWDDPNMPSWTVEYDRRGGLGLLNGFVVDSHYSQRGREGRLIRLLADTHNMGDQGTNYGIGLDENTAIHISNVNTAQEAGEVMGEGGVMIADVSNIVEDEHEGHYRIRDIMAHYLTEGDTINLSNMEISYAEWKTTLTGRESNNDAPTSDEIFEGDRNSKTPEFVNVATGLFDSTGDESYGDTWEDNPNYRVWFSRVEDPMAEGFEGTSPDYNVPMISYQYLHLDMYVY